MIRFKTFITESIRQGLPHITTMDHKQFAALTKGGKVDISNATEKTDGSTFLMGHDEKGFFTQYSGSSDERMRNPEDYAERAMRRSKETGKPYDPTASNAFSAAHAALQKNKPLMQHLEATAKNSGGETKVRGELFSKALARPSETPGEIKFVGTSYHPEHMGSVGKFVIHTQLPENRNHDVEKFKKELSSSEMNFDDDKIQNFKPVSIDVSKHLEGMKDINSAVWDDKKTAKNKPARDAEEAKLAPIRQKVSDEVDKHIKKMGVMPKWGSGSEGMVVHPKEGTDAPRFKVTSDAFRDYKASDESKNFKNRSVAK
jgi:hypothetical protein